METHWIASRTPARELSFAPSLLAAIYRADGIQADGSVRDDLEFSLSIRHKIREAPDKILEIVADEITANPEKVCEIVKASIKGSDGSSEVIASIVETAGITKPEHMRLAAQCAVASMPESLPAVQEFLARLNPAGRSVGNDSKDCKDAKEAKGQIAPVLPDPLDQQKLPRVPLFRPCRRHLPREPASSAIRHPTSTSRTRVNRKSGPQGGTSPIEFPEIPAGAIQPGFSMQDTESLREKPRPDLSGHALRLFAFVFVDAARIRRSS